jgi:hypothetical protein
VAHGREQRGSVIMIVVVAIPVLEHPAEAR